MLSSKIFGSILVLNFFALVTSPVLMASPTKVSTIRATPGTGFNMPTPESDEIIQVCTVADLEAVRQNLNGHYKQICNIDLGGIDFKPIGYRAQVSTFTTTGYLDAFTGVYDGGGFTIRNYKTHLGGLFGIIGKNLNLEQPMDAQAKVKNLRLEDIYLRLTPTNETVWFFDSPNHGGFGIVANINYGTISNITASHISIDMTEGRNIGGIVGWNYLGTLSDVHIDQLSINDIGNAGAYYPNFGPSQNVGGIVGYSVRAKIEKCSVDGKIVLNGSNGGGIAGVTNQGSISFCQININLSPNVAVGETSENMGGGFGGIVGQALGSGTGSIIITDATARGNLRATSAGGIVGSHLYHDLKLIRTSFEGSIIGAIHPNYTQGYPYLGGQFGGLVGVSNSAGGQLLIQDSYFKGSIDAFPLSASVPRAPANTQATMGGLIGYSLPDSNSVSLSFVRSYAETSMKHYGSNVGGIVGYIPQNARFTSTSTFFDSTNSGLAHPGPGTLNYSTWTYDYPAFGSAKTSQEMQTRSTYSAYSPSVWDFSVFSTNVIGTTGILTPVLVKR